MQNTFSEMTPEQKAFHALHKEQLAEANNGSASATRRVYDTYYNTIKTWKANTVLHQDYMYNGKPYYVTVEDAIYSAKVNAGWDRSQVQEALDNLSR